MNLLRLCTLAAVLVTFRAEVFTTTSSEYRTSISYDQNLVKINGTLKLNCTMSRQPFWKADDIISWYKRQPIDNITIEVMQGQTATIPATANKYSVLTNQPTANILMSSLTIKGFRIEDYGFYRCGLTSKNLTWSTEVFVQAETSASVTIYLPSARLNGVYVYDRKSAKQNTSCSAHISGDATNVTMQMRYSGKDTTQLFSSITEKRVTGNTTAFKAETNVFTLSSRSFVPPSETDNTLECRVLHGDGTILASDSALIRLADEGPEFTFIQEPAEAVIGGEVKITCHIANVQFNQSKIRWVFTNRDGSGMQRQIKISDGSKTDLAEVIPFETGSQLTIHNVTSDMGFFNITLVSNEKDIASTEYMLILKDAPEVASSASVRWLPGWIALWTLQAAWFIQVNNC